MQKISTIKEVQKLIDVSDTRAGNMINVCRSALLKEKPKILFLKDFCDYYEITIK
ncbi:MAG: hypothetical protein LBS50_11650 [Prevotellaceae bacterium]|jgi:hypothetical protein|nr:hypothetical protein [Prevotellaceae bacterium]